MRGHSPVTVQAAANTNASRIMVRSSGRCGLTADATAAFAPFTAGNISQLIGSPIRMCAAAQAKQVSRQPMVSSPQADSGHPTVEAKPAISVMPVIERRASLP
jgi:hypothetical protein